MAVILLLFQRRDQGEMRERRENTARGTGKGVQKGSENEISNLLLITWYPFQKENHFIALYANNCYYTLNTLFTLITLRQTGKSVPPPKKKLKKSSPMGLPTD